jgi:hypothetical protein
MPRRVTQTLSLPLQIQPLSSKPISNLLQSIFPQLSLLASTLNASSMIQASKQTQSLYVLLSLPVGWYLLSNDMVRLFASWPAAVALAPVRTATVSHAVDLTPSDLQTNRHPFQPPNHRRPLPTPVPTLKNNRRSMLFNRYETPCA